MSSKIFSAPGLPRAALCFRPCFPLIAAGALFPFAAHSAPLRSVQTTALEGQVEVRVEDYPDHAITRPYLKTRSGVIELVGDGAAALETGDVVRISGQQVGGQLAVAADTSNVALLASAPAALTLGAQQTLVMLVNFLDDTSQPWTVADARTRFFSDVTNFYLENSFRQTWLTGDVVGWYTLPIAATCSVTDIAAAANQAATAAGVNVAAYSHLAYAYPSYATCGWSGQGSIGGNPSQLFLNGDLSPRSVAHELGHNFGLFHSQALDCGASVTGTNCTVVEYGDRFDTMGIQGYPHFNAFQKERLGWLNYGISPGITTVQASGTYPIDPYETPGGTKALKILKSTDAVTGAKTWYYIEYRQALGFDSALASMPKANFQNGVLVHLGTDGDGRSSDILDMTPGSSTLPDNWNDVALVVGKSFTDTTAGVSFATSWADSTSAGVTVSLTAPVPPPPVCARANPAVALSGSTQSVGAGSTLSYTFTLTNQDSSTCPVSTFSLSKTLPSGWSGILGSASLSVAPGASATTTLSVSSPTTAKAGNYTIGVTAANGSFSATAASIYSVAVKGGKKR